MKYLFPTSSALVFIFAVFILAGCGKNNGSNPEFDQQKDTEGKACTTCGADTNNLVTQLKAKKFLCDFYSATTSRGPRCQGFITGYPQPVNIFIAPNLNAAAPITVSYHLHGWWTGGASPVVGDVGDYGKFVADSGKNVILVVPESTGKNTTYRSVFTSPEKTTAFLNHVDEAINAAGTFVNASTARLITGHSAAYVTLASIGGWVASGKIAPLNTLIGVGLLDTAYDYRDGLVGFMTGICKNNPASFFITYNPADGSSGKKAANEKIYANIKAKACKQAQIVYNPDKGTQHLSFMKNHYAEFLKGAAL